MYYAFEVFRTFKYFGDHFKNALIYEKEIERIRRRRNYYKKDIHRAWLKSMEKRDDDVLSKARLLKRWQKEVQKWQ